VLAYLIFQLQIFNAVVHELVLRLDVGDALLLVLLSFLPVLLPLQVRLLSDGC
jgi:hypothetical protein